METDFFRFFERGSRVSDSAHDDADTNMAANTTGREDPSTPDPGLKTLSKKLLKRIQKLQSTASSDPLTPELFAARAREGGLVHVSTDEVELHQASDGGSGGGTSDLEPGLSDGDKDAHLASTRSPGQAVWRTSSTTAHPEGHDHGDGDTDSHHPWRITLALVHPHANEMRGLWHQLSHSGLWQLVLGRMRSASIHRSPLAQHLGKMLDQL